MENEKVITGTNGIENAPVQNTVTPDAETFVKPKPQEKRCPNCQAAVTDEQMFCPECGTPCRKLCPNCKTELRDGQAFCPSCGQKVGGESAQATTSIEQFNQNIVNSGNKAHKKKKALLIIAVVLAIGAVISYFIFQNMKETEYKENAETFSTTVLTAAANLENIGNEVKNEWHDYIYNRWSKYDSIDEAVMGALLNMSDEISTAKSQKSNIDALYSKLKKPATDSDELDEVCQAVKELYNAYEDLYDCVTDPDGSYNSFTSDFGNYDSTTVKAYEQLSDLCEDFN